MGRIFIKKECYDILTIIREIMKKIAVLFCFMNSVKIKNDKIMKEKNIKILKRYPFCCIMKEI